MPYIKIANLGPIKECRMDIENFTVLTGQQASGKSTIAKCIYFCRTIKDDIRDEILKFRHSISETHINNAIYSRLRNKFLQIFGTSLAMDIDMKLEYYYSDDTFVTISLRNDDRCTSLFLKPGNLCEVSMKGIHHVEISNRDARFKFDLNRNITIIRGKSGTGKTTMFDMISDFTRLGEASGVNISCDKNCVALTDIDWKNQLSNTSDSIVFIDEGVEYLNTKEFAKAIKNTDNYYVIFNRETLRELPYSVDEIYEIKASGRFHSLKKMYKSNARHFYYKDRAGGKLKYDILLTEDSKSGLQFLKAIFRILTLSVYLLNQIGRASCRERV